MSLERGYGFREEARLYHAPPKARHDLTADAPLHPQFSSKQSGRLAEAHSN